jgi:hypothetical protein
VTASSEDNRVEPKQPSPFRWIVRAAVVLGLLVVTFVVLYLWPDPRIIVSRETTYLTEPLDEDGYVDYVAAVNQRGSKGVTAENNAAVLYWQALGPAPISEQHRMQFFMRLGVDPLPMKGDYFEPLVTLQERLDEEESVDKNLSRLEEDALWHRHEQRDERRDAMLRAPWTQQDDPLAAKWLNDNRQVLGLFLQGTKQERHFVPTFVDTSDPDERGTLLTSSMYAGEYRTVTRALLMRSMYDLADGHSNKAWQDCLGCFRIANHIGDGSNIIHAMASVGCTNMAAHAVPTILHDGKFSSEELNAMRIELRPCAKHASVTTAIDLDERLMWLDLIQAIARGQMDVMDEPRKGRGSVDWNLMLREFNTWIDKLVAEMRKEEAGDPNADVGELIEARHARFEKNVTYWAAGFPFSRSARTHVMISLWAAMTDPAVVTLMTAERKCKSNIERLDLVFALEQFRAQTGKYPRSLAKLVPAHIAKIPLDPLAAQPFRYRAQDDGYMLWSVGPNGVDDDGRTREDYDRAIGMDSANAWDDHPFIVPRRLEPFTEFKEETADR